MIEFEPLAKIIIVSGNSERQNALAAIDKGAHDIFPKPVDLDELKVVLHRVYRRLELEKESIEERTLAQRVSFEEIIGTSPQMQEVFATVRKVAGTDIPVLITGEWNRERTDRERYHNLSDRKDGPFVAINCGAIPETLLESELFGHEKDRLPGRPPSVKAN